MTSRRSGDTVESMDDSADAPPRLDPGRTWLLLIHQLPPKPDYLRVKIRRRLKALGAIGLKNTVYALSDGEDALEDFTWLVREIEGAGGSAMICRAEFLDGISDEEIEARLDAERSGPAGPRADPTVPVIRSGSTWVTRAGVFVDRIASAWLIRRFIDPAARFKFVAASGYAPQPAELRFDMFEAEFGHEGDLCTFEVLCSRLHLAQPGLRAIAEVVHDIDLKDAKFGRPETDGVAAVLTGLTLSCRDDEERLEHGSRLLDQLLAFYARRKEAVSAADGTPRKKKQARRARP